MASDLGIERVGHDALEFVPERRTVVTALPLKRAARERLAELLHAHVVDIRQTVDRAEVVLTPACSPQMISALKARFEGARVIVVELDDWEFDIDLEGPVKRSLRGGADGYVLAESLDELARKLSTSGTETEAPDEPQARRELPSSATVDDVIGSFLRESQEYSPHARSTDE